MDKSIDSGFNAALQGFIERKTNAKEFAGYHYNKFADEFQAIIKSGDKQDLVPKYRCERMTQGRKADDPNIQVYLEAVKYWPK